jgi:hypothetical protein
MNEEVPTDTPVPDPQPAPAPPPEPVMTPAEQAIERAEAAATRRRWVSLAELVGVAGLIIAAISLWMSWSDRRADVADKQAEQAIESKARTLVTISGAVEHDGETIKLGDAAHPLHDVEVTFPSALGVSPQSGLLGPKIDSNWFDDQLLALSDKTHQGRLPVILAATYWDGNVKRTDRAIYEITWISVARTAAFLRGRKLKMRGLVLSDRNATPARLEAAWARLKPAG